MKNYEKYADKIKKYKDSKDEYFCNEFIIPHILKKDSCADISCEHCHILQMIWLLEECEETKEPETDWSKVEVDTPILVRNDDYATTSWLRRYFAEYDDGVVYAWNCGCTSWSETVMTAWKYAKLAESEDE